MNWDAMGAVGEIVGAMAVVVSLVYLASQIRISNRLSRAEAWRTPTSDLNHLNSSFGLDPKLREAFRRAYFEDADRSELDDDKLMVLDLYLVSITNIYEQIYREIREGILEEDAIEDFGGIGVFSTRYYRSFWPVWKTGCGRNFVRYFEAQFNLEERDNAM